MAVHDSKCLRKRFTKVGSMSPRSKNGSERGTSISCQSLAGRKMQERKNNPAVLFKKTVNKKKEGRRGDPGYK